MVLDCSLMLDKQKQGHTNKTSTFLLVQITGPRCQL